jgi:hypothetical protein
MGQWWRVKPPIDSEFLVLVVAGRVAVAGRAHAYGLFEVGDRWVTAQQKLKKAQFTCVEEWPP